MSDRTESALEVECQRLRKKYPVWMTANDISLEESVSTDTAQRHLKAGKYGVVDILPGGARRVLTANYIDNLTTRTRVFKATA